MGLEDESLLLVNNLSKTFAVSSLLFQQDSTDNNFRLNNISFGLKRGESLCLIGLNGSGKSTLLKILSGITLPDTGSVRIEGPWLSVLDIGAGFHPDLTGFENIELVLSLQQISKKKFPRITRRVAAFSELNSYLSMPIKYYSAGMYLRLAMALMMSIDVNLMIIDEVISVGDINFQQKCIQALHERIKAGASIVLATHDFKLAELICNKCVWLDNGNVVMQGETPVVINAFLTKQYSTIPQPVITEEDEDTSDEADNSETANDDIPDNSPANIQEEKAEAPPISKPVSKDVRLLACKVSATDKAQPINELQKIEIEFTIEKKSESPVMMGLVVCDKLKNPVIGLTPLRSNIKNESENLDGAGVFSCSVSLPPYFLNANYFVLVLFIENYKKEIIFQEMISSFVVEHIDHNFNGADYIYKGEFGGPIYMPGDWSIVKQ